MDFLPDLVALRVGMFVTEPSQQTHCVLYFLVKILLVSWRRQTNLPKLTLGESKLRPQYENTPMSQANTTSLTHAGSQNYFYVLMITNFIKLKRSEWFWYVLLSNMISLSVFYNMILQMHKYPKKHESQQHQVWRRTSEQS